MNGRKTIFKIIYQRKDRLFWFIPFWTFAGSEVYSCDSLKDAVEHASECLRSNDWRIARIKPVAED